VDAVAECLIPVDQDPGAHQAGVVRYIDTQLTRKFRDLQGVYRTALANLDRQAGRAFVELSAEEQTALLAKLEKGEGSKEIWGEGGGKPAFEMWLAHTQQGFYGSPRHGGNRDYASWRMVGIPPVQVRGRLHYDGRNS
jgi:gluconate 2-dehydrogenase gamma chain